MLQYLERHKNLLLAGVLAAGVAFSFLFGSYAYNVNMQFGFPLDDPWIHLQFAKNLHEYGSFSYFKNEMTTAGSTSPLYTVLLAIGFFFTSNEMILSYLLGTAFLLASAFFVFRILSAADASFVHPVSTFLGLGGALLLLLEPRMQWAALSGMETTLFICLLLATLYFYQSKQRIRLGIAAGLLLWTRPEAAILYIAIALDVIYHALWVPFRKTKKKSDPAPPPSLEWMKKPLTIAALFAVVYAGFNLYLSGSIFPNTFAAKLKYYGAGSGTNFPKQVFHFLADGQMVIVVVMAAIGLAAVLVRAYKRQSQSQLVAVLFSLGLFAAYWMKLPYLYQEGRYMMPLLPFLLMCGVYGLRVVGERKTGVAKSFGASRILVVQVVVLLVVAVQFAVASLEKRSEYAGMCQYINDRQVRTATWLRDYTPENAIIGTHDIGAIAFYSGRKIADMVGLVSPEMIERIGNLDRLHQFLAEKHVTHVAVLRNWFEIVNQRPLFQTDEQQPEIMEVFAFDPHRTHLVPHEVSRAVVVAGQYLYQGQFNAAAELLGRAVSVDPQNSKAHHYLGIAMMMNGKLEEATREFHNALQLHPEYLDARIGLAQVAARQRDSVGAISQLETIMREHPDYPIVYQALADVYVTFRIDSVRAQTYMKRYRDLVNAKHVSGRRGE